MGAVRCDDDANLPHPYPSTSSEKAHGLMLQVRTPRPRVPGSATGGKAPSAAAFRRQRNVLAGAAYRECGSLRHEPGDSMVMFVPCQAMPMSVSR